MNQTRTHMLLAALVVATCLLNAAENVVAPSAAVPLIAVAKPDQFVTKGQTVTLDGSSSRLPAGPAWTHQWRQTAGPAVVLRDAGRPQASFTAEAQANYTFELTISDGQRASADQVRVSVVTPTGIINGDFDRAGGGVRVRITASSAQPAYPADNAADGDPQSFWVSGGYKPGDAPSREKPEWIRLEFDAPFTARSLRLIPRDEYGPRTFDLQVSDGQGKFHTVTSFELDQKGSDALVFPETTARVFRLLFTASHVAENVQVRDVALAGMPPAVGSTANPMPAGWRLAQTFPTASVAVDPKGGEAGSAALRITTQLGPTLKGERRDGVVITQPVQLEPYRVYTLKARVRGENVQQGLWNDKSPEHVGPSVAVDGWLSESFRNPELNARLKGTFGWTDVELDFPTGGDGTALVRLQSGQGVNGKVGTGTVWFDNVRVEPAADRVTIMGSHVVRFFRKEALDKLQPVQAQEYVREIDAYYDTMSDLTGKAWYGKQVIFHPHKWSIWAGAWSGNPALVNGEEIEAWTPGRIREVPFQGGPIHELAHNLAVAPLWGEIPPGTLAFYTVRELNLTCGDKRGMAAVDSYHAFVHKIGQEGWAKGRVNQNLIQDKFMLIAKRAGWRRAWDTFKQVFRMVLVAQDPGNPRTSYWKVGVDFPASEYTPAFITAMKDNMWQQFKAVFDAASRISGFDMWSVFSKEEIAAFEKQLGRNDLPD